VSIKVYNLRLLHYSYGQRLQGFGGEEADQFGAAHEQDEVQVFRGLARSNQSSITIVSVDILFMVCSTYVCYKCQ